MYEDLKSGDLVRWDRRALMAFEKVERTNGQSLFLEETPKERFEDIGGLGTQIEEIRRTLDLHLFHPEITLKYKLRRKGSVLLSGPPGTGKTMLARALASYLAELSPSGRSRFINVKLSDVLSVWYSQSEKNISEVFRVARDAGEEQPDVPVVLFFDECDSITGNRGESHMRVDDRVLSTLITELDGLTSRGNILVVAATNRLGAIDPALIRPGRLGDLVLEVPRPNMKASREIFERYMPSDIPYASNEQTCDQEVLRDQLIGIAVSRLFSPNADTDLALLTFRDGKQRVVKAKDLVSGASIANIARNAIEMACKRECQSGESGIKPDDILTAIANENVTTSKLLTPYGCKNYLTDLPQDVDVVRVDVVDRKVRRPHAYISAT